MSTVLVVFHNLAEVRCQSPRAAALDMVVALDMAVVPGMAAVRDRLALRSVGPPWDILLAAAPPLRYLAAEIKL